MTGQYKSGSKKLGWFAAARQNFFRWYDKASADGTIDTFLGVQAVGAGIIFHDVILTTGGAAMAVHGANRLARSLLAERPPVSGKHAGAELNPSPA